MRKLLLASAAVLGGLASGQAIAQTPPPAPGPLPPTWTEGPQPTAPSGIAGANSNLNAQGFYTKGPLPAPTPGSIVVHFNGRVVFYGFVENQTSDRVGGRKAQPYGTIGYFRFYPGVDGMTSFGLRYGASVEIRTSPSYSNASTTSGGASGATYGSANTLVAPGTSFTYVPGTQLIVRRAFAYIGGDWGAFHFGQDDGPLSLLDAGVTTFQTYNDGGWNDDLNANFLGPDIPVFPFPSAIGNEYATSKVVYLSPQIAGFDFGASFEPDDNPLNDSIGGATTAFSPQLSTGILPGEIARRRNSYQVAARYQGALGPAGLYIMAGYIGSGVVNPGAGATAPVAKFDGLGAEMGGIAVNFGGLRVGGSVLAGRMNNQMALKVTGADNMFAWLAGVQYTLGPMTVGASYLNVKSAGALAATGGPLPSQRREGGINVGGTYVIAPGLLGWLSATYGQRYQGGFNFNTGALGPDGNNVKFEAIALGGMVRW
ncbi:MAG TPA: porin [Acetobacteraceae bacterium]|nr:porin [Acetobacteraceae bacterium]